MLFKFMQTVQNHANLRVFQFQNWGYCSNLRDRLFADVIENSCSPDF